MTIDESVAHHYARRSLEGAILAASGKDIDHLKLPIFSVRMNFISAGTRQSSSWPRISNSHLACMFLT
jgi:hypothetical protein